MAVHQTQESVSAQRLRRLRARMKELKLNALFTLDAANLRWLTAWQEVFDDEQAHVGIITGRKAYIHTDSRYIDAMRSKNIQGLWQVDAQPINHAAYARSIFARTHKQALRLGFESTIPLNLHKLFKKELSAAAIKLVETKQLFLQLRATKDAEEVRVLRKAQRITDAAFADLLTWIEPGMRELEVANRLEFAMRQAGAQGVAFESIVASGPNSALPHARPTSRRLRKGDFLVLDFGARFQDYCADMTRTLVMGKASDKQRSIYIAVLDAQEKAKAGIRAGATGREAHELAYEVLTAAGYEKQFTHSLGHGVGIAVHELPLLSPHNARPLLAGNIVTVEPGVYLPGYGGVRIEDFGLVEDRGFKSFTRSPHELIEIHSE